MLQIAIYADLCSAVRRTAMMNRQNGKDNVITWIINICKTFVTLKKKSNESCGSAPDLSKSQDMEKSLALVNVTTMKMPKCRQIKS
jgi:hypothetical protein